MTTPTDASPVLLKMQHQWPMIARDIAMMTQPNANSTYSAEDIAKAYDLTETEFVTLTQLPVFVDLVRAEFARMKELGPFAGHRLRAEAIVGDLQERLYAKACSGEMDDKHLISFLEILMKSAGIDAPIEHKQETNTVQTNVNIAFNIPKLPNNKKLSHLVAQPHNNVIDVTG